MLLVYVLFLIVYKRWDKIIRTKPVYLKKTIVLQELFKKIIRNNISIPLFIFDELHLYWRKPEFTMHTGSTCTLL